MEPVAFTKALEIIAKLVCAEYEARRYNAAYALLHALGKLASEVGGKASDWVSDEIMRAIAEGPRKLQQQLDDPASKVTPELFIAGLRRALLEPQPRTARPSFEEMIMKMWAMQRKKGADYGSDEDPLANLKASEAWGLPGWQNTLSRLDDKRFRIISFILKRRLLNESAYDAFRDFAVYSVHMWRLFCEWLASQEQCKNEVDVEFEEPKEVYVLSDESEG